MFKTQVYLFIDDEKIRIQSSKFPAPNNFTMKWWQQTWACIHIKLFLDGFTVSIIHRVKCFSACRMCNRPSHFIKEKIIFKWPLIFFFFKPTKKKASSLQAHILYSAQNDATRGIPNCLQFVAKKMKTKTFFFKEKPSKWTYLSISSLTWQMNCFVKSSLKE